MVHFQSVIDFSRSITIPEEGDMTKLLCFTVKSMTAYISQLKLHKEDKSQMKTLCTKEASPDYFVGILLHSQK